MCNFWHPATLTLSPECQSARMPKITNDGLTRSGTGCFIDVPLWQQWVSNGYSSLQCLCSITIAASFQIVVLAQTIPTPFSFLECQKCLSRFCNFSLTDLFSEVKWCNTVTKSNFLKDLIYNNICLTYNNSTDLITGISCILCQFLGSFTALCLAMLCTLYTIIHVNNYFNLCTTCNTLVSK